jgi:hypothetical protein
MPGITATEARVLLEDAWSCTTWQDYGIPPEALAAALDSYATALLVSRGEHDRTLLRSYLNDTTSRRLVAV